MPLANHSIARSGRASQPRRTGRKSDRNGDPDHRASTIFFADRSLDYLDPTSLAQLIGTGPARWPLTMLKEAIDSGLDAAEEGGSSPPTIEVRLVGRILSAADSGPGLPRAVVEKILDFNVRASTKSHHIKPIRCRQGNALKCQVTAPAVMPLEDVDEPGFTKIESHGTKWTFRIRPGADLATYNPIEQAQSAVNNGTKISFHWLSLAFGASPTKTS